MKELNYSTKKAQSFIEAYDKSEMYHLLQAYDKPSARKWHSFLNCMRQMDIEEGSRLKIISKNTFQFACAWKTKNALRVETRDNSYIIYLPF